MSSGLEETQAVARRASTLYLTGEAPTSMGATDRRRIGLALAAEHVSSDPKQQQAAIRAVHPDVLLLEPATSRGKIGIDQVREILRAAQFVPEEGERRVCLIPQAERLTPQAANGLLKVLEEPPRGMVFVLIAAHAQDVLPTVLSRLQVARSSRPTNPIAGSTASEPETAAGSETVDLRSVSGLDQALVHPSHEVRMQGTACLMEAIERKDRRTAVALARLLAKRDDAEIRLALSALMQGSAAALRREVQARSSSSDGSAMRGRQRKLAAFCRGIDQAQRAMWVYTPKETVLVKLLLDATEETAA